MASMRICFILLFLVSFGFVGPVHAQKFGYVDKDYILTQMPSYATAQKEADKMASGWQREIEGMQQEIDKLERNYQAEEILLTEEMKKKRQYEVAEKKRELREFQSKVFGYNGYFFKKREELIKPVLAEIAEAAEKVAKQKQLQFIFDNSGAMVIIYMNPTHDYTEFVLEELGLASSEQNTPGRTPVSMPAFDSPTDLPMTGQEEELSPQQERRATPPATNRKTAPTAKKKN
jgi:outer membrane protein